MKRAIWPALGLAIAACAAEQPRGDVYRVYLLAGQSNMEGYGLTNELRPPWTDVRDDIRLFVGAQSPDGADGGGAGRWTALRPGYGAGLRFNGARYRRSNRFGPELSFGARIAALRPNENIALVKYTYGASTLALDGVSRATWSPDYREANRRNQYDNALTTIETAFSARDINGDGATDQLIPAGIIWMQGEGDAFARSPAGAYSENLPRMIGLLRAALRVDGLPVVIGRITDSGMAHDGQVMDFIDLVHAAQRSFVEEDVCAAYVVDTEGYQHTEDAWHYVSDGYIEMGQAFAEAMVELEAAC